MRKYVCDKCRKEVDRENLFTLEYSYGLTFSTYDDDTQGRTFEFCEKCLNEVIESMKVATNWREKLR